MCIRDRLYALSYDKFIIPNSKTCHRVLGNASDKNSNDTWAVIVPLMHSDEFFIARLSDISATNLRS